MNKTLLLSLLLLTQFIFSQSDYREGFIILKNKDTLKGYINYKITKSKFKKIEFKKTLESKKTEYTPLRIDGYGYKKNEFFKSVKINQSKYNDTFFIETLVSGNVSLYKLYDDFFIEKDTIFKWLDNEKKIIYRNGTKYNSNTKRYLGILKYLFKDCKSVKNQVIKTPYKENDLVILISNYNSCKGVTEIVYKKNKPWIKTNFGAFVGYNFTNIKKDLYELNNTVGNTNSVSFGAFLEIASPRIVERVSFYTGLVYNTTKSYQYEFDNSRLYEFESEISFIKIPIAVRYTFPERKNTPYFNIGILNVLDINSNSVINTEYVRGTNVYTSKTLYSPTFNTIGFTTGFGIKRKINSKLETFMDVNYEFLRIKNTTTHNYNLNYFNNVSTIQLLIGLRF